MHEIVGHAGGVGWVALKALLLFLTGVVGFRLAERRTIAEMNGYDFVAAVAVGAIVGRVPNSSTTSYLQGAVTLVTILVAHACITRLRYVRWMIPLIDHRPRLLVVHGNVLGDSMRRSGLTPEDLYALLRAQGVRALNEVRYAIFEARGRISVIREDGRADEPGEDVLAVLAEARRAN